MTHHHRNDIHGNTRCWRMAIWLRAYGNVFCGYILSWQHIQRKYIHSNSQKCFIRNRKPQKTTTIRKLHLSYIWQCFLGHSVSSWQRVWMKDLRLFRLRHHDTFEHVWTRYVGRNAGLRGEPRPGHLSSCLCSIHLSVMTTVRPLGYHRHCYVPTHTRTLTPYDILGLI